MSFSMGHANSPASAVHRGSSGGNRHSVKGQFTHDTMPRHSSVYTTAITAYSRFTRGVNTSGFFACLS